MPRYFVNFGLDAFKEEEAFLRLANFICKEGRPFVGYRCIYIYKSMGRAEMIATMSEETDSFQSIV